MFLFEQENPLGKCVDPFGKCMCDPFVQSHTPLLGCDLGAERPRSTYSSPPPGSSHPPTGSKPHKPSPRFRAAGGRRMSPGSFPQRGCLQGGAAETCTPTNAPEQARGAPSPAAPPARAAALAGPGGRQRARWLHRGRLQGEAGLRHPGLHLARRRALRAARGGSTSRPRAPAARGGWARANARFHRGTPGPGGWRCLGRTPPAPGSGRGWLLLLAGSGAPPRPAPRL